MGEEAWRIHTVGAPGLDRLRTLTPLARDELAQALGLPRQGPWVLVTFHPVTLEYENTAAHVDELLAALDKVEGTLVMTYPNADTAGRTIIRRLEEFAARAPRARLARTLGDRLYLSLLRHADAMVGNSSSGLIEAPSFELPVVNIGSRQRGRLRGDNVIDTTTSREAILRGLETALTPEFRARLKGMRNPYGDGYAAGRIVEVLRAVPLGRELVQKRDVLPAGGDAGGGADGPPR
jgi:UDP-hydrolysing UDP-N-acetyl-D-glucosamine 2-epimerase